MKSFRDYQTAIFMLFVQNQIKPQAMHSPQPPVIIENSVVASLHSHTGVPDVQVSCLQLPLVKDKLYRF